MRRVSVFIGILAVSLAGVVGAIAGDSLTNKPVQVASIPPVQSVETRRLALPKMSVVKEHRTRVAAGDECPANSGSYCSDSFPVCCLIHDAWQCVAKLSDCHE